MKGKIIILLAILLNSIYVLGSDNSLSNTTKRDNINYFPYQEGFPVELPLSFTASRSLLTTFSLYGQNESIESRNFKGIFMLIQDYWNYIGKVRVYDYKGQLIASPDYYACPPAYVDFNFDGIDEIIANQWCPYPWDCYGLGITVKRLSGWTLNGFPNPPNVGGFPSPAIEDIDRDGNYDIVSSNDPDDDISTAGVYILGSWGGIFPGFPLLTPVWIPDPPSGTPGTSFPMTIGDFDDDGYMEVVYTGSHGYIIIKMDGSYFRNWPQIIGTSYGVSLADIDDDNKLEIISNDPNGIDILFALNEDATFVRGYPISYPWIHAGARTIPVVDANEDGRLEMFVPVGCIDYILLGYGQDGTMLPNFPIPSFKINGYWICPDGRLTLADIDGDNEMEILLDGGNASIWCPTGVIVAYNLDGTLVEGFPIITPQEDLIATLTVDDLDGDGDIEICAATTATCYKYQPNYLYCWDLPYPYNPEKVGWKKESNSDFHTSRYFNLKVKPPVVESVQPNSGNFKGGTRVVIKGKYFQEGARVFFGGIQANNVQVIDSNTIYATTPAHKPCFGYINDLSVSPYELSFKLLNQPVIFNQEQLGAGKRIEDFYSSEAIGDNSITNGCLVNIVVAHPSPDQREGILRAAFIYTGWEPARDDVTLFVSKHVAKGTFEHGLAYWQQHVKNDWDYSTLDSWHVVEDGKSDCIQRLGNNNKFIWFGQEETCNYYLGYGVRNSGCVKTPAIYLENEDSALSFWYYRDVELNYFQSRDITEVIVKPYALDDPNLHVIWYKDSRTPSEKQWLWSGWIPLSQYAGKYVEVQFCFDNVIGVQDNHIGWAIDDVQFINARWRHDTSEIILEWQGGIPKYFVYRSHGANYNVDVPELRSYTSLNRYVENSYNNDENYYYKVK